VREERNQMNAYSDCTEWGATDDENAEALVARVVCATSSSESEDAGAEDSPVKHRSSLFQDCTMCTRRATLNGPLPFVNAARSRKARQTRI
jgi:hypothetical protein